MESVASMAEKIKKEVTETRMVDDVSDSFVDTTPKTVEKKAGATTKKSGL